MLSRYLGIFLTVSFFLSVSVLVTLTRRPICIDSRIVEKIDRVSHDGLSTAWACALNRRVPFDEEFFRHVPELQRKLVTVESFLSDISPLSHRLQITWIESTEDTIRVQGTNIYISRKKLLDGDDLQRSVLRVWLREQAINAPVDRSLLETSLVDLMMVAMGQAISYESSTNTSSKNLVTQHWPNVLKAQSGMQGFLLGSVRPLISESMSNSFMQLNATERGRFLRQLPTWLAQLNLMITSQLLSEDSQISNSLDVRHQVELVNEAWHQESNRFEAIADFSKELEHQLNIRGFSSADNLAQLDYLFQLGADMALEPSVISRFKEYQNAPALMGVTDGKELLLLPGDFPLERKIFGLLKAREMMYLSCEIPSNEKLLEFSKITERVLYVRFCGDISELNFRDYITRGYSGFAEANPQMAFVQMHLPSLIQASHGHLKNPLPALAEQDWKNPFFTSVGWQSPVWDESLKFYKTKSVIQAIEAYRPLSN